MIKCKIFHKNEDLTEAEKMRENQANIMASAILMPEETFKQVVKEKNGLITEIAKAFNVSPLAVRFRAKTLGIKGHGLDD